MTWPNRSTAAGGATRGGVALLLAVLALAALSCAKKNFSVIPLRYVYNVKVHGDSVYCATLQDGIFAFAAAMPQQVRRIAGRRSLPFRSLLFVHDTLLAASYQDGACFASGDTMLPLVSAPYPAWSIKLDARNRLWLAGTRGVWFRDWDKLVRFSSRSDAHDVDFYKGKVAIALQSGISLFDMESGKLEKEWCRGMTCWTVTRYDSLFIGGGSKVVAVIDIEHGRCAEVPLVPEGNIVWGTARDARGTVFCATQKGLYAINSSLTKVTLVGCKGQCIKSVCFDKNGRLWVGRFTKKR